MPEWRMKGQYIKNCNCIAFCPCDADGDPSPDNFCKAIIAMQIQEGRFGDADLGGLHWAIAVDFPGPLYEGNGTVEYYVDERGSAEQRDALTQIVTGKAGGAWFEIIATVAPHIAGTHVAPFEWAFDKAERTARLAVPGFLETTNAPIRIRPTGDVNRMTIRLPDGAEYKEMDVAHTTLLRSTGGIQFEYAGKTSGGLAEVEHTHAGLVA